MTTMPSKKVIFACFIVFTTGFLVGFWERIPFGKLMLQVSETAVNPRSDMNTSEKIPNIVHYQWYSDKSKEFPFTGYLSVVSVFRFQKPRKIYFHTNMEPNGKYWKLTKCIPTFEIVPTEPPKELFGKTITPKFYTSFSNLGRLLVLYREGGIYLDTDVFILKSLDDFRKYEFVAGYENDHNRICSALLMSQPKSVMLKLWLDHFMYDEHPSQWGYNMQTVPSSILKRYPELAHIVKKGFHRPSYFEFEYIYKDRKYDWSTNHALHLWNHALHNNKRINVSLSPESIKRMNNTAAEVARYIMHGYDSC